MSLKCRLIWRKKWLEKTQTHLSLILSRFPMPSRIPSWSLGPFALFDYFVRTVWSPLQDPGFVFLCFSFSFCSRYLSAICTFPWPSLYLHFTFVRLKRHVLHLCLLAFSLSTYVVHRKNPTNTAHDVLPSQSRCSTVCRAFIPSPVPAFLRLLLQKQHQ